MMQTPSKRCMPRICGSSHLYICKLEWFEGKHSWVDGNINKCSLGPYKTGHSVQGPVNSILCTRNFNWGGTTWKGDFKCREVKNGFFRKRWIQTGSSGTLIGWKSGQTTYFPLWDRMEGSWLWPLAARVHLWGTTQYNLGEGGPGSLILLHR